MKIIDNENLALLENMVNLTDEFGLKYIELIKEAMKDGRTSRWNLGSARSRKNKEKLFSDLGKEYIYCEVHHIIPVCCGGSNNSDNLVYLYCTEDHPEHVLAHEYLWRCTSLFQDFKDQLLSSFFKMTYSRKLSIKLSAEDAAKLRKDYGDLKSRIMTGKYGNRNTNKIMYNGILYPSSTSLTKVKINGKFHDRHTILDWARYGLNGLSLESGEKMEKPPKKIPESPSAVKISYNGKIYSSARGLVGVKLEGGKIFQSHMSILEHARKGEFGMSLVNEKDQEIKRKKPIKEKVKKPPLTREDRALFSPKSIKISYKGEIYPSARSLEDVILDDGKRHPKDTIIKWARENKHGLSLVSK